jgi:ribosomal protein S27E
VSAQREPQCTRFFGLAPRGLGTGLHESLPSYLDRLARLHSVRNGPFLVNEVHPKPVPSSGSLLSRHSRGMLIGNSYAERIASAVALSTGVPEVAGLVQSTLSRHLGWYKNTRPRAAWCPLCFADWAKQGLPIYRPLLWSLNPVRCCPIHNVFLLERCPGCLRDFNHFGTSSWSLMCPGCGRALSEYPNGSDANKDKLPSAYDNFCASRASDLLAWGLRCSEGDLPHGRFAQNIGHAIAELGSEYALGHLTALSRPVIQKWRHGHGRPLLPALLRLCHCFDVPIHHWVSRKIPAGTFVRGTARPNCFPTVKLYASNPAPKSIEQAVLAYLAKPTPQPCSVRELAEASGTKQRRLYDVCPRLVHKVVMRRAHALAREKERNAEERVRMVRGAVAEIRATGRRASRKVVLGLLNSRGVKCSWLLKEVFRREIQSAPADGKGPLSQPS